MDEHSVTDELEWGLTREQYAAREKRRIREREKARRQRNLEQLRRTLPQHPDRIVFVPIGPTRESEEDDWHLRIKPTPGARSITARAFGDPEPGRSALELFHGKRTD